MILIVFSPFYFLHKNSIYHGTTYFTFLAVWLFISAPYFAQCVIPGEIPRKWIIKQDIVSQVRDFRLNIIVTRLYIKPLQGKPTFYWKYICFLNWQEIFSRFQPKIPIPNGDGITNTENDARNANSTLNQYFLGSHFNYLLEMKIWLFTYSRL